MKTIESLPSISFKDRRDKFAHDRSFYKIDGISASDSITVDLFKRSARAISSQSIFLKDQPEQVAHGQSAKAIRARSIFFKRLTRAIRPRSIFYKDKKDRKIEDRKIEFPTLKNWLIVLIKGLWGVSTFLKKRYL